MSETKKTPAAKKPAVAAVKKPAVKTPAAKPVAAKPAAPVEKKQVAPVAEAEPKKAAPVAKKAPEITERNQRHTLQGKVLSNKMDKTIVVAIVSRVPHPLYKKTITKTKKLKAHDEQNQCDIGDTVEIQETRPLSKDKYFRLVRIVEKVK